MKSISPEIVDQTWRDVASMDPEDAGVAMFDFSEEQPNLLGFGMVFADELDTEASELCTYMLFVIYRIFAEAATDPIPVISEEQIETQYKAVCNMLESMHDSDDEEAEHEVAVETQNQPYVYQYVSEVLFEDSEDPDEQVDISDEDVGEIFMLLKCVIDTLDEAIN